MEDNILQLPKKLKTDRFRVWLGQVDDAGYVVEKKQAGYALQKSGSAVFRLKLWMFLNQQYFVIPSKEDQTKYNLYSLEEYKSENKEMKLFWNKVGDVDLVGNYLRLKFNLFEKHLYLSLFNDQEVLTLAREQEAA